MMFTAALAIGLLFSGVAVSSVRADSTIFSNLGPGDSYQFGQGLDIGWWPSTPGYQIAGAAFTVGATSMDLSTIQVAVATESGLNQLTVSLDANVGGLLGATIESFALTGEMAPFGGFSSGHLVVATSVLHPLLAANTEYWVVVTTPNDGTTAAAWCINSTGGETPYFNFDNGVGETGLPPQGPAMLITGFSAVPEPSSVLMIGTGAVVILGCALRRRSRARAA